MDYAGNKSAVLEELAAEGGVVATEDSGIHVDQERSLVSADSDEQIACCWPNTAWTASDLLLGGGDDQFPRRRGFTPGD